MHALCNGSSWKSCTHHTLNSALTTTLDWDSFSTICGQSKFKTGRKIETKSLLMLGETPHHAP